MSPRVGLVDAGDEVEERRLARAVRADDADDLALVRRGSRARRCTSSPPNALETFAELEHPGHQTPRTAVRRCHDVLLHAHVQEQPQSLERPCQAAVRDLVGREPDDALALEEDVAGIGLVDAVSRLNSVVLPAPFGPMTLTISPGMTTRSRSSITCRPPNDLLTPRNSSIGCASIRRSRRGARRRAPVA